MQANQAVLGVLGLEKQRKRSLGRRQGVWAVLDTPGWQCRVVGAMGTFQILLWLPQSHLQLNTPVLLYPGASQLCLPNLCPLCLFLGTQGLSLMGFVSVPSSFMLLPTKKSPKPKAAAARGQVPKLQQGTLAAPGNSLFPCHEPAGF